MPTPRRPPTTSPITADSKGPAGQTDRLGVTLPPAAPGRWTLSAAAVLYPLWVLHGSLLPLSGWNDIGVSPLAFLHAAWPRYWTGFDVVANVLLYLPLGFLWTRLLQRRLPGAAAAAAASILAALLSLSIEVLQNWLPGRVPSNLDLFGNIGGAMLGAILAGAYAHFWAAAAVRAWNRHVVPVRGAHAAFALLAVWALIQLPPDGILFSSGLVRNEGNAWLPLAQGDNRLLVEATVVAAHTAVVALLAGRFLVGGFLSVLARVALGGLLVLAAKGLFAAATLGFAKAFEWLTPGAQAGLLAGALIALPVALLPARARAGMMLAGLVAGTVALLILPPSPYVPDLATDLHASPARNAIGALTTVSWFWPFALAAFLVWQIALPRRPPAG
jgi:VanZ family protein